MRVEWLAGFRGVDADNIVLTSIIGKRAPKNLGSNLPFMDLGATVQERLLIDTMKKVPQSG